MRRLLCVSVLLIAGVAPVPRDCGASGGETYYYEGRRKVPLVSTVSSSGARRYFRSLAGTVSRSAGDQFYLLFPPDYSDQDRAALETAYGLTPSTIPPIGSVRFYRAADPEQALATANRIVEETQVLGGAPLWTRRMARRSADSSDPLYDRQWYLNNTGQNLGRAGEDIDIQGVWQYVTGTGVSIAVVDDGIDTSHPDLAANVEPRLQYDFVRDTPSLPAGTHGTQVAGVAAAVGFNGIGVRGVAPGAKLAGLRLLDDGADVDEQAEIHLLRCSSGLIDVFNNSWGPPDGDGGAFSGPSPAVQAAMTQAIASGRNGLGPIFVWAAGNGGPADNSNLDGYANQRYVIAVSATTDAGRAAPYAEPGANILLNAPSGGGTGDIITTDVAGSSGVNDGSGYYDLADPDYTATFNGTSAATPVVSGVVALMLQANPGLGWREVRAALAMSARQNDPGNSSWKTNGAGLPVSTRYGFGRVDAAAAVSLAANWHDRMAPEQATQQYHREPHLAIPDNNPAGITDTVAVLEQMRIETVELTVDIPDHTYWGDIDIRLVSPSGTEIQLAAPRYLHQESQSLGYHQWTMRDVLHGGELSRGVWSLRVSDAGPGDTGTLESWSLKLYGTTVSGQSAEGMPRYYCQPYGAVSAGAASRGIIGAGVSHHGSLFRQEITGMRYDDFLVVATLEDIPDTATRHALALYESGSVSALFARTDSGWIIWNGSLDALPLLPGFASPATGSDDPLVLYQGRLAPGRYTLYTGYSTADGGLSYSPEPLRIAVE